jgi:NAD(P) transhydrogenase subunit alpha
VKVNLVGVLDDRAGSELRVALVPSTARRLAASGFGVMVESGAGIEAKYTDASYSEAGCHVGSRDEVLDRADLIVMVARPRESDIGRFRAGQVLVGLLRPSTDTVLASRLAERSVVTISLDGLPRTLSRVQAMDVLTSQASVAGYKAVLVAANAFGRYFPMFITAAGTSKPANVLVLGAGVAGLSAIGTAHRLGALVTAYDLRPETRTEVESLGARFLTLESVAEGGGTGGYARALTAEEQRSQQEELEHRIASFDIVITTAQVPGRKPPVLVSASAVARMAPGTVLVDMACGPLGGNVEGSMPSTTTVTAGGVTVIGAGDLPSSVATSASDALSQNMAAVVNLIVREGELQLDVSDPVVAAIVVTRDGKVVHPAFGAPPDPDNEEERGEPVAAV